MEGSTTLPVEGENPPRAKSSAVEDISPASGEESDIEDASDEIAENDSDHLIHLKLHRRWVVLFVILLILVGLGLAAWHLHWYQRAKDRYTAGSVTVEIEEGTTALAGAHFSLRGVAYTTDVSGKVVLQRIPAGKYPITITHSGYSNATETVTILRGGNGQQSFSLTKLPGKQYAVKGFVTDYISGKPVTNVQVTFGSQTMLTDPSGAYSFADVVPSSGTVVLSKVGYTTQQIPVNVTNADVVNAQVPLVPAGQVIFVSNRDGQRALYTASYDGSNQHVFTQPQNGGEDFLPFLSPDSKSLVFSSTRSNLKDSYGNAVDQLYVVGQDGQNPKQMASDVALEFSPLWSPNSQWVYFSGYTSPQMNQATYKVYNLAKGSSIDIGEAAGGVVFAPDSSTIAYYVVGTVAAATPTPSASPSATVSPTDSPSPTPQSTVTVNIIKTLNLNTGERKTVTSKGDYVSNLQFSTDGKSLSYDVLIDNGRQRLQTVLASGQESQVAAVSSTRQYVLSPDHTQQVFAEERDGKTDLYLVDAQGNNEKRLTTIGVVNVAWTPEWDSSGNYIIFADKRDDENALYIVSLAGGDPKKIADYYVQP